MAHWVILGLELFSRASCQELFACGLHFIEHLGFLGMRAVCSILKPKAEPHISNSQLGSLHFLLNPSTDEFLPLSGLAYKMRRHSNSLLGPLILESDYL